MWPLRLRAWTLVLRCGSSRCGAEIPRLRVTASIGDMDSHVSAWPLGWGYGLLHSSVTPQRRYTTSHVLVWAWNREHNVPLFGVAPRVGDRNSYTSVWPLKVVLGIRTPTHGCFPSSARHHLRCFVVALESAIGFPTPCCGAWSCGHRHPRFSVATQIGDADSHASVWPLDLGIQTPTLRCGPSSWGCNLPYLGVALGREDMHVHASVCPHAFL